MKSLNLKTLYGRTGQKNTMEETTPQIKLINSKLISFFFSQKDKHFYKSFIWVFIPANSSNVSELERHNQTYFFMFKKIIKKH